MSASKRLIVNADGFGFGPGATQGILDAISEGKFISSISVNANFADAERIPELVESCPHVSIGIHLNPIAGRPCLPPERVPSLVGSDGFFRCKSAKEFPEVLRSGVISLEELGEELNAQIARVKELAGDHLTHIDSQGNRHLYYLDLFLHLAQSWGLRRMRTNASVICLEAPWPRWSRLKTYLFKPHVWLAHRYRSHQMSRARSAGMRMADGLVTVGYAGTGNKTNPRNWLRVLQNLPPGTYEIYCHPAYPDDTLRRWSYYCEDRGAELALLRQPMLLDEANKLGIEIIGFDKI